MGKHKPRGEVFERLLVLVPKSQKLAIAKFAQARGMSVPDFIREAITAAINEEKVPGYKSKWQVEKE